MKDETLLPEKMTADYAWGNIGIPAEDCSAWADGWNARAAPQSGNSGQPVTVPAGYVLVPVEPTVEMRKEFHKANDEAERFVSPDHQWQAMLAAAPKAPDGWIPVSERMPEFFYWVLVADEHDDFTIAAPVDLSTGDKCAFRMNDGCIFLATHWQQIPGMPKVTP